MPHSHRELFYHLVWSTKGRLPSITPSLRPVLIELLRSKATALGCQVFALNCLADHVHLLLYVPPHHALARVIRELKGGSSYGLRRRSSDFAWQEGYGVLTLRRSNLPAVKTYIENQEEHHHLGTIDRDLEDDTPSD